MSVDLGNQEIGNILLVGDRVLIKPRSEQQKTRAGLLLPPGMQENEKIQSGYVIRVGPGYPIPAVNDYEEPWKDRSEDVKYVPLQANEGDMAVYVQNSAWEVQLNGEEYHIVGHSAILLLVRDKGLFV